MRSSNRNLIYVKINSNSWCVFLKARMALASGLQMNMVSMRIQDMLVVSTQMALQKEEGQEERCQKHFDST